MTEAFDQRIVSVGIEIDGKITIFEKLDIRANGQRQCSPTEATATIVISNLTKDQRNQILTKASPLGSNGTQTPIRCFLDVGRESYGTFRMFDGGVWALGATQPPDIGIVLESTTDRPVMNGIVSLSFADNVPLKVIAQKIADMNNLTLEFKVKNNKNIANYSYNGSLARQIQTLATMGDVKAYVAENRTLVVIDADESRNSVPIKINAANGMVGIPQPTASGVVVKTLINKEVKVGTTVEIKSTINPSVNGNYRVEAMQFEVSNRQNSFFYTLFCTRAFLGKGTQ